MDFDALEKIAVTTGGQFFIAQDQPDLAAIYARIDELTVAETRTQSWRPRESMVHWPAGAAAILGIIGYGIMILARRLRKPVGGPASA